MSARPDMIIIPSRGGWSLLVNDPGLPFDEALAASASTQRKQGLFDLAASLEGTVEERAGR